jgi:hypothetical protein
MKHITLSAVALFTLLLVTADGRAQRLDSGTTDHIGRPDTGMSRIPDRPSSGLRHRDQNFTPESHVPSRSPDLGESYFPLSPSIGPGSGLLGPESGRGPSRLKSSTGTGSRGTAADMGER